MEDQYANEARMADRRGDSCVAAEKYLLAVQAATNNKLSDTRIQSFTSYICRFMVPPEDQEDDYDGPQFLHTKNEDLIVLNSFLNNPDEPTIFRTKAAAALAGRYHFDATGRRDADLAAIYARRCIQECFKASIEERNHRYNPTFGLESTMRVGEVLDGMRGNMTDMLHGLEYPADAHASQISSIPYPVIATSYCPYEKQALVEIFGDGVSLDHLARRLTVGGVTCDCCGKKRDHSDLCSLLCCDRCEMTYYCSADCQRRQWREGGHKKACRKPGEFREGDAIRLDGLKATPQYNHRIGIAVRQADNSGDEELRWAVRTWTPDGWFKILRFKAPNMRRIRPADIR